jgi:hypothetical protein
MKIPFCGGCACGAIRDECAAEPIAMFNCHCRDCQRASGGPYSAVVYVPAKGSKITKGEPRYYRTPSKAMGHNLRGFCPVCGSRLFGGTTDEGQGITASSLDDPTLFVRSSRYSRPTHSRGIIWTRRCRSSKNMRRKQGSGEILRVLFQSQACHKEILS